MVYRGPNKDSQSVAYINVRHHKPKFLQVGPRGPSKYAHELSYGRETAKKTGTVLLACPAQVIARTAKNFSRTLLLKVLTQINFVADFYQQKISFMRKNCKVAF